MTITRYMVDVDFSALPVIEKDVIVIGAGIAGLFTAIRASETQSVLVITKKSLMDSNTRYAQGGIAAVTSDEDSPAAHREDTLIAGAGLCKKEAVDILAHEGPKGVRSLIRMGTQFDVETDGEYALTREGAHSQRRILHANGDATGYEIVRALSETARSNERIETWEDHFVIDLVTIEGECIGAIVQKPGGQRLFVRSKATVLCCGGAGQLYRYTTNPEVATGDGVAMAYRAGAFIQDAEFIQFHPTALCYPGAPRFLISEAVRGEGAYLRNVSGERFMERYHEQLELAPRDIVARAIVSEMEATRSTFVYIDITHEDPDMIRRRFPTIYEYCLAYGLDMTSDWIPVAPAMHYMMGGVRTDLFGETNVKRLFACGEVSSTGVHGANRLASNSLSEAIVYGRRIAKRMEQLEDLEQKEPAPFHLNRNQTPSQAVIEKRLKLQKLMVRQVGVRRDEQGLRKALDEMRRHLPIYQALLTRQEEFEFVNLLTCAMITAEAALYREESRGGHYRSDFTERDDVRWLKHTLLHVDHGIVEERAEDE